METSAPSTPLRLWLDPGEESLWHLGLETVLKRVSVLTGLFVLLHTLLHSITSAVMRRYKFPSTDSLVVARDLMTLLHSGFSFCAGVFISFLSAEDSFQQDGKLFSYSVIHDLASTTTVAFWLYSIFFIVPNATSFDKQEVVVTLGHALVCLGITYYSWLFPCVVNIKLLGWWNLGGASVLTLSFARIIRIINPASGVTFVVGAFVVAMGALLLRLWGFMFLLFWAYRWVSDNFMDDMMNLGPDHPVGGGTAVTYLTIMSLGSIGVTYLAFLDFKSALALTKDWSEEYKKNVAARKRAAAAAAAAAAGGDGANKKPMQEKPKGGNSKKDE